jgi:hypothetical protein
MKKMYRIVSSLAVSVLAFTADADVLLFKGTNMASYTVAGSWTNLTTSGAGRVPIYGDSANIINTSTAQVALASAMNVGAAVNVSNNAAIYRTGVSGAYFSGTLSFRDNSSLTASQLALYSNAVLNWSSAGVWNGNGANSQANFYVAAANNSTGPTINMSAGTWNLTGNTAADSFQLDRGIFNMSGGKILCEDNFKIGSGSSAAVFNLSGSGEIWLKGGFSMFGGEASKWDFSGTNWTVYATNGIAGIKTLFQTRINTTNIYANGSAVTVLTNAMSFSTVSIDGTDYTKVVANVIPEPATISLFVLSSAGLIILRRAKW